MGPIKTKQNSLFSNICSYLNKTVFLDKETWYNKIIPAHPEVRNCIELIEQILFKDKKESVLIYKKKHNPNKVAVLKKCPNLWPNNQYIKIALSLTIDNEYIVRSIYGQNNLPSSDMEEIK